MYRRYSEGKGGIAAALGLHRGNSKSRGWSESARWRVGRGAEEDGQSGQMVTSSGWVWESGLR